MGVTVIIRDASSIIVTDLEGLGSNPSSATYE